MTPSALLALLPIIVVAATVVVVMLAVGIYRHHRLTAALTAWGLLLAVASIAIAYPVAGQMATPMLIIDDYALFYIGLLLAASMAGTFLFYGYIDAFGGNREELYILMLLATLGAIVLVASADFSSLFIGLELLSVSLFGMVAYPVRDKRALEAAIKYLVLSGVASGFLLFGMALVYAELGTMSLEKIGNMIEAGTGLRAGYLTVGGGMIIVAIGFKLSVVPFHFWTPDVYEGAPAPVTGFLATISKGAVLALALRYYIESSVWKFDAMVMAIHATAFLSILVGNLLALMQKNIKRILAYSSIAHFGYVLVALVSAKEAAVEAVTVYIVTYFVTTLGAFGVLGLMSTPMSDRDADSLWDYRGLFWKRPFLTGVFTFMILSLAGIPLTAGFIGKFYVVWAGVDAQLWVLLAVVVIGSAIGLFYYLRMVITLYLPEGGRFPRREVLSWPQKVMGLAMVGLAVVTFWMGVYPQPLIAVTKAMSGSLH